MSKEKKSVRLTEDEIRYITLGLSNQRMQIAKHIETLRTICSYSDSTEKDRTDLNNEMDHYFNVKELQSFLYGVFDDQ